MPTPVPPPTPGSSTDLRGKEGAQPVTAIKLPPNAFQETEERSTGSGTPSASGSDSSYRPVSPASPADLTRKRSTSQAGSVVTKHDFALPPPPTRSRKIIQMKPRDMVQSEQSMLASADIPQVTSKSQSGSQSGGKRGQTKGNATAASRKIARKTAHSLIERRRRSKMNEEFGVLKDMIPACKGQEMHKLAILQASIDYLRYLEQCVAELKAQNKSPQANETLSKRPNIQQNEENGEDDDEDIDEDEEMEDDYEADTAVSTPSTAPQDRTDSRISLPSLSQITTTTSASPSTFSTGAVRHYSVSSASQASFSPYIHANQASPAFGPQLSQIAPYSASRETFGLGSPALKALDSNHHVRQSAENVPELSSNHRPGTASGRSEQELDHEATAALLMLNNDRRSWRASKDGETTRGTGSMSVRDLLSS